MVRLAHHVKSVVASRLRYLLLQLLLILGLHIIEMMWFEQLSFAEAAWVTFTTVTTVGYGDVAAHTLWGRISTVIFLYVLGIWMLAQLAGEYLDFRMERRERIAKGFWRLRPMNNHIVIVNAPNRDRNGEQYLVRLMNQLRHTPSLAKKDVVLVTDIFPEGLPKSLVDTGVIYKNVDTSLGSFFENVSIQKASYVILLAQDAFDPRSDSLTLDLLHRFADFHSDALIVTEAVQDTNFKRFKLMGANAVLRPIRAYPELVVRALSAPGTECILEDLFRRFGASIYRYDVEITQKPWKVIACALIEHEIGMPLGYVDHQGDVKTCPVESAVVSAKAILLMARDDSIPSLSSIEQCISAV